MPGSRMGVADYTSRMYSVDQLTTLLLVNDDNLRVLEDALNMTTLQQRRLK